MNKMETRQLKVIHLMLFTLFLAAVSGGFARAYLASRKTLPVVIESEAKEPTGFRHLATIYGDENFLLGESRCVYAADSLIYISDTSNRRVVVLDANGSYLMSFGDTAQGDWPGLAFPYGIVVANEQIYVADAGTMKVTVFDLDGNYISFFGENVLVKPVNIVYQDQTFYFTDVGRQQIVILNEQGDEILSFGQYGRTGNPGELNFPNGLAVAHDGIIYVADTNNSRIQVFDGEGQYLNSWRGDAGIRGGSLVAPMNIALDADGNLYAADPMSNQVKVFNSEGLITRIISDVSMAEAPAALLLPTGIYIDSQQQLLVSDTGNRRLVMYALK